MSINGLFPDLICRVRAGEEDAAAEFVQQYYPVIENAIRLPLMNSYLGRVLESHDICQTVLANFFVRACAGQFDLDHPGQLVKLLVCMARNQVADEIRRYRAGRRDHRRLEGSRADTCLVEVRDRGPTPSKVVAGQELVREMYSRLSDDERELAEQRLEGRDWASIAKNLGGNPDALRKKLTRAIDRVVRQLGLEELR